MPTQNYRERSNMNAAAKIDENVTKLEMESPAQPAVAVAVVSC